jgi:hypothetical protein
MSFAIFVLPDGAKLRAIEEWKGLKPFLYLTPVKTCKSGIN